MCCRPLGRTERYLDETEKGVGLSQSGEERAENYRKIREVEDSVKIRLPVAIKLTAKL